MNKKYRRLKKKIFKKNVLSDQIMGSLRFELRISAMSRRRHNQLDHEPPVVPYNVGQVHI